MSSHFRDDDDHLKIATSPFPSHTFKATTITDDAALSTIGRPFGARKRLILSCCVLLALVHPTAMMLGRVSWTADLICHFQEPAIGATLLSLGMALILKGRRVAFALMLLAVFQGYPLIRYSVSNPVMAEPSSGKRVRLLMANVLFDNTIYDDLEHLIRKEQPDIVGLVEYTPMWRTGLAALREEYPYRMEWPTGASGLALWFKTKPRSIHPPEWLVEDGHPVIHASFDFDGEERHLWLVHPRSPLNLLRWKAGNPEVEAIAENVAKMAGSRIVMGDMNTTEGSVHFRDFLAISGLRDSRLGFGRQGSWPTDMPYRIAIDHLFLSSDLAVVDRRLGYMIGSDHFPLIVDLAPAASTKSAAQTDQSSKNP